MSSHFINAMKNAIALVAAYALYSSAIAGNVQVLVLDKEGKPVTDAVVVMYPNTASPSPALVPRSATVLQEKMRFVPEVTVVTTGTSVHFTNLDRWDHHLRGTTAGLVTTPNPAGFEIRLAGKEEGKPASAADITMDKPGAIQLGCHIHGSMRGSIFVTDSDWTLKTNGDGTAQFANVPNGAVKLRVWHADQLLDLAPQVLQVNAAPLSQTVQLSVVPRRRRI
jgi:plastocyanin